MAGTLPALARARARTLSRMIRRLDRERHTKRTDQPHRFAHRKRVLTVARQIAEEMKR